MNGPAKNRLHDYEAGWLTLLRNMGIAEEKELYESQNCVARAAIEEMEADREKKREKRRRRRGR
jgi:hypothetical protein